MLKYKREPPSSSFLEKLKDFGSYAGLDENAKRRHFLQGITDSSLHAVISSISGDTTPKTFDECVEQFNNYIHQRKLYSRNVSKPVNVSAMSSSGNRTADGGPRKGSLKADNYDKNTDYSKFKCAVRFYNLKEWNKLSSGQRNFIRQAKAKERALKEADKEDASTASSQSRRIASLEAVIQQLVAGKKRKVALDDDTSTTESEKSEDSPSKRSKTLRLPSTKRG